MSTARYLSLALMLGWAGVLFYLSSQPSIDTPDLFTGQDKLFHLIAYGLLGFLAMGAMRLPATGYRQGQAWTVAVLVALYGVSDEIHQHFVPGRTVEVYDVLADALGGLLGAWLMFLLIQRYTRVIRHM